MAYNKERLPKCPVCKKTLSDPRASHCRMHMIRDMTNIGFKKGDKPWLGKKHSLDTRKKMSDSAKNRQKTTTGASQRRRKSLEYTIWRKSVFERDNYTCVKCGQRGGRLNAHHKKQFAYYPELKFDLNNGETLCENCHKKIYVRQWNSKGYDFITHEDSRRTVFDWYSGEMGVMKSIKVVDVKSTTPIGDHYHKNKIEIFFLVQGEFLELKIGSKTYYNVPSPYKLIVPKNTYHKFTCTPDSILLGAATELFDENDEIK